MGPRIVVTGGRSYSDGETVRTTLDRIGPSFIAQGGASGADYLARWWAWGHNVPCRTFKAQWRALGKRAGPLRNQAMLDEVRPDVVVAFPGERGTADCCRRAEAGGYEVRRIPIE